MTPDLIDPNQLRYDLFWRMSHRFVDFSDPAANGSVRPSSKNSRTRSPTWTKSLTTSSKNSWRSPSTRSPRGPSRIRVRGRVSADAFRKMTTRTTTMKLNWRQPDQVRRSIPEAHLAQLHLLGKLDHLALPHVCKKLWDCVLEIFGDSHGGCLVSQNWPKYDIHCHCLVNLTGASCSKKIHPRL